MQAREKFKFDFKHACTHRFNIKKPAQHQGCTKKKKRTNNNTAARENDE